MKMEIDIAREEQEFYFIPHRAEQDTPAVTHEEVVAARRAIRMVTDSLTGPAMLNGDAVTLLRGIVETMTAVGGTCSQFGLQPDISDFMLAGKDLVEDARVLVDRGLVTREWEQVRVGAAMIQCVCAGVCAILGLPYKAALDMSHAKRMAAEHPQREDYERIMKEAGFQIEEKPNEPTT